MVSARGGGGGRESAGEGGGGYSALPPTALASPHTHTPHFHTPTLSALFEDTDVRQELLAVLDAAAE